MRFFVVCATALTLCTLSSCERHPGDSPKKAIGFVVRSAVTKVSPITTESIKTAPYGEFRSDAFYTGSGEQYYSGATAAYTGEFWPVTDQYWPDDTYQTPLDFWSYAPKSEFSGRSLTYSGSNRTVSFNYSPYSAVELREDAVNQQDVIIGCNVNRNLPLLTDGAVPVKFNHALSAVRFKMGAIDPGFEFPDRVEISSVTISGINGHGVCTADYVSEEVLDIEWDSDQPAAYAQNFTPAGSYISTGMFLDTYGTDPAVMGEGVFMIIPQTLSGMTITINWSMNGLQYTSRTSAVSDGLTLLPGTVYTFTLNLNQELDQKDVHVSLTDVMPWTAVSTVVDYSHIVTGSKPLEFDPASCFIDEAAKIVTFKDTQTPIRARFKLTSPEGSVFLVNLKRDFDAFTWDYVGSDIIREPDDVSVYSEFIISPAVLNPERNYYARLGIVVRASDGRVINCDHVLQGPDPVEYYTIVLQKAI